MHLDCNQDQFYIDINSYKLDEYENICSNNSTWFSLKNLKKDKNNKSNMFKINEGDVIKIGKIIIRIRKIKFESERKMNNKFLNIDINNSNYELTNSYLSERMSDLMEIGPNKILSNKSNNSENKKQKEMNNYDNNTKGNIEEEKEKEILSLKYNSDMKKRNYITPEKIILEEKPKNISSNSNSKICRICYLEEDTDKNPLIQPCSCSGSLKYIHLDCLRQWIGTRNWTRVESNENCCIYLIKEIDCELCKNKLPDYIRHKNKLYKIIEFKTEFKNYISFENLTLDKQKNKFIYVINLDTKKEIKIGRGHESNIILSDISVSRVHCILNIHNKNIYLEDNEAKYGTLVLIQTQRLKVIDNIELNLQIGRTFINCKIKRPFKFFKCCNNVNEVSNYNLYFKQNAKKIVMKKVMTVKTEVDEEEKEFILEDKKEIENIIKQTPKKLDEPVLEIDVDVDEDENVDKSNINITKYTFISNDNCKNILFNSMNLRKIDVISSLKSSSNKGKGVSRNSGLSGLNSSTGIITFTHRAENYFQMNK